MSKNKKKNKKTVEGEQELSIKIDRKMVYRILAGVLAAMMVLGTVTMTVMYLFGGHVH